MICNKCKNSFYPQVITEEKCMKCGEKTYSPHLPAYIICKKCSEKYNQCEQCGKKPN